MSFQPRPVLAYYSIRSKQEYIYRTNAIREIVGASEIIKNAFDYFKTEERIVYELNEKFVLNEIKGFANFDGIVLTEGGGNLIVLFKSEDICKKHNSAFSAQLITQYYSLTPLCAFVTVELEKDDYAGDYQKLMEEVDRIKKADIPLSPCNTLPFVKMNRNTWQPIVNKKKTLSDKKIAELTAESAAKYAEEKRLKNSGSKDDALKNIKFLDELVTRKGEESLLAIVYADGNNMGKKIGVLLKGIKDYDGSVEKLRGNSETIDNHFIKGGIEAVTKRLKKLKEEQLKKITSPDAEKIKKINKQYSWRRIVGGGDEITFICNARIALDLAKTYLNAVNKDGFSSSAGIVVFHSHYPFATAYKFAEQACENAKDKAKKYNQAAQTDAEISMIDFHYIHSGIETDLESVRLPFKGKYERPYLISFNGETDKSVCVNDSELRLLSDLETLAEKFSPARTSIKEMGQYVSSDVHNAVMSFERICSHKAKMKEQLIGITGEKDGDYQKLFRLFYDLSEFYDIWFKKDEEA